MIERMFPVLPTNRPNDCPSHVKWSALDAEYAQTIHSQSLERLAQRGGLSAGEIVMNVERRPFTDIYSMDIDYAVSVVKGLQ